MSFPVSVLGTSGTTAPTGTVSLIVNGNPLGRVTLSGGTGTFSTAGLPTGTDAIQANYGGDANYSASSSPTVTVSVSQSSGCVAPASAGVVICSPAANATVGSPVQAEAAAKVTGTFGHMELWVDGVKKYSTASNPLNTSLSVASGTHRFAFLASNTAGTKWSASVNATVSSSGQTTPTITWANPASITYGTPLSGTELNATANVAGSFV